MRISIIVSKKGEPVMGCNATTDKLRTLVSDRAANGEGFPGEQVVRLPRRASKHAEQVLWDLAVHHWPGWVFSRAG